MSLSTDQIQRAWQDVSETIRRWQVWFYIGLQEIKLRYRRSVLGPFWITISMAATIVSVGVVYSAIFQSDINNYMPFFAVGYILWFYLNALVNEGSLVFITDGQYIRQVPGPLLIYVFKCTWRLLIIFFHNALIIVAVLLYSGIFPGFHNVALSLLGLVLVTINGTWIAISLAILSARYRDIPPIVQSLMGVAFFLTPILWDQSKLPRDFALIAFNPFYHFIEVIRSPLLERPPQLSSWLVTIGMAVIGSALTFLFFARYRRRIAYWV